MTTNKTSADTCLPSETKAAKRSTVNGVPQTCRTEGSAGGYAVPSYFARRGFSIDDAARSLGLRVLGRRDDVARDDVVAELHEQGGSMSFRCVRQ